MSFRHVFIAVAIAFSLVLAGFLINRSRPKIETEQAGGDFVPNRSQRHRRGISAYTPPGSHIERLPGIVRSRAAVGSWSGRLGLCVACSTESGRAVDPCLR
jgi:hypothetical protein